MTGSISPWTSGEPASASALTRSNSTRSWAACWSIRYTPSGPSAAMYVDCTWPSTLRLGSAADGANDGAAGPGPKSWPSWPPTAPAAACGSGAPPTNAPGGPAGQNECSTAG